MYVIACIATKGGSGKTTLAMCLSVLAATEPKTKVGLLDLDPQKSLADWWQRRGGSKNPQLYSGVDTAGEAIDLLEGKGLDLLFIDTGPGLLESLDPVVGNADFILVPIKASALDLTAIQPVLEDVETSGKPYLCVLNECISTKMEATAAELLKGEGHPVAKSTIKQRIAYRSATTTGFTGPERDDKCDDEIKALWKEVKAMRRREARV